MQTTRRTLLKSAVALAASLRFARAANPPSPVIVKLGNYMSEAAARALPDEVIEKTKHHILDTLAAMVSGTELPPGKVAQAMAKAHTGEKTATVVGTNILCGPIEAAMVNGMLAHSDETDDSHAPSQSHPGCSIVPATLAASEQFGTDGTRMIRAVALGYDIGTRVTMTLGALDFQLATHHSSHSIAGDFGSSAAAGCVANLNPQQMRWILDYAGQQAAGSRRGSATPITSRSHWCLPVGPPATASPPLCSSRSEAPASTISWPAPTTFCWPSTLRPIPTA